MSSTNSDPVLALVSVVEAIDPCLILIEAHHGLAAAFAHGHGTPR